MSVVDTLLDAVARRTRALASGVRFGQFASVGVLGAICDNGVLLGLTSLGLMPVAAKLVGAETAIIVMFAINEHWTFADEGQAGLRPLGRRFLTSNVVRAGGVLVATGVFALLVQFQQVSLPIGGTDLWYLVANVIGIGVGFVVNYLTESLFTWQVHK
jgi:putative flippase GtrA